MYWPAAHTALSPEFEKQVTILNTVVAITASCITACGYSIVKEGRLHMGVVLNATLGGGVVVGTASAMIVNPSIAILIGAFGGLVSAVCVMHLGSFLQKAIGLHDTCGVNNLHGVPGILSGIIGAIATACIETSFDGDDSAIAATFPAIRKGRTISEQAGYQLLAVVITFGISVVSGAFTGFITSRFFRLEPEEFYNDKAHFEQVEFPGEDLAIEMKELGLVTERDTKV